jgi:hypothetical protein
VSGATLTPDPPAPSGPVATLGARIGLDEGQSWTVVVGAFLSTALLLLGLPGVLAQQPLDEVLETAGRSPAPAAPSDAAEGGAEPPVVLPAEEESLALPAPTALDGGAGAAGAGIAPPGGSAAVPVDGDAPLTAGAPPPGGAPGAPEPAAELEGVGALLDTPLSIVDGGSVPAPPQDGLLRQQGLAEDGVTVDARAGQGGIRAYVRLAGTAEVLRLRPVNDLFAGYREHSAALELCKVTETGWTLDGEPVGDDGPTHDADDCVPGVRAPGGTWTWDLAGRTDITDDAGWALLPAPSGLDTWRVTLARRGLQASAEAPPPGPLDGLPLDALPLDALPLDALPLDALPPDLPGSAGRMDAVPPAGASPRDSGRSGRLRRPRR